MKLVLRSCTQQAIHSDAPGRSVPFLLLLLWTRQVHIAPRHNFSSSSFFLRCPVLSYPIPSRSPWENSSGYTQLVYICVDAPSSTLATGYTHPVSEYVHRTCLFAVQLKLLASHGMELFGTTLVAGRSCTGG